MADAYVNFHAALDPGGYTRGAQCFQARAAQAHRAASGVGATAAEATAIALGDGTEYAEIGVTSGSVFACILPTEGVTTDAKTAARIRIDQGDKVTLSRALGKPATLYIWAV